ncbi:DNA double-strand break repair Rad50 ATPase [uncultured archaeon]|nr:DNA double-strand break repair Rad50 ATPase [uncultured archaeon]
MLTCILLENWRSHEKTELRFRKGTNLLVGIMGSGKSSVLDAISFALFGTFPALEHRKLSLDELIRHEKDFAKISLSFDWKGESYEIIRRISMEPGKRRVASDAEMRKAGKLVEKGQTAVTKYAEQLLQVDYDLFSRAIYSEQNNIDYFLNIDPAKRKQELDTLLGLDRFEAARGNAVTLINRTRSGRKALEEKFSRQKLDEIRKKEQDSLSKCASLENSKKELSESASKTAVLYAQSNSAFVEMSSRKAKADALRDAISRAKGAIGQLKEELAGKEPGEQVFAQLMEKKAAAEKSLAGASAALLEVQEKQNSLSKEAGAAESRLEAAKLAAAELDAARKELERTLAGKTPEGFSAQKQDAEKENLALSSSCQSLSNEIRKLEEGMRSMKPGLSQCPVCRCSLTPEGIIHVLDEYKQEMARKKEELRLATLQKEEKTRALAQYESTLRKIDMMLQKQKMLEKGAAPLDELSKQIPRMQEEAARAAALAQSRRQDVEKATSAFQQLALECKTLEDLLSKKNRLAQVESALNKSEGELVALKFSESEFEAVRKDLEDKRLQAGKLSSELKSIEAQLKDAREFLALAGSERSELEAMDNSITKLLKLEEELSIYKNVLLETQAALRREVIDAINTAMNGIWPMVYPYGDYKGLRMSADEKGYEFQIYDGSWRASELASGGERASIALTFRIALATVLTPNMSILVLDEPTHNLDKEAVAVLAHALQYNLPELVEQSFVITHEEGLMGSEFASTYRMARDKEANGATKVEEM